MSSVKSDVVSNGVFLIGLGILFYTNWWWPGILLLIWIHFAIRQLLTGRRQDFIFTSLLLGSLFIVAYLYPNN